MVLRFMAVALLAPIVVAAQEPSMRVGGDPAQVMRAFLDAIAAERWSDAAHLVDPGPIEQQRRQVVRFMRRTRRVPEMTIEDYMRRDPQMPRAVAEYHIEQYKRNVEQVPEGSYLTQVFAGVTDTTALNALTPVELAARWVEAQDPRYQMRRARQASACDQLPVSVWRVLSPRRTVLGAIERGDTAYVVHKDSTSSGRGETMDPLSGPMIATLYRRGGAWQITPNEMLLRPFGAMSFAIDCETVGPGTDSTRTRRTPRA